MTALSHLEADWFDTVNTARSGHAAPAAQVNAGVDTGNPQFALAAKGPQPGDVWGGSVYSQVGDVVQYRVRFNTTNGSTPFRTNITYDQVTISDLLPRGMAVVPGSISTVYSGAFSGSPPSVSLAETACGGR
jgi:uncharacterized repeat protein (TIGR01451 family)